jgi:hypothetical protein
VRYGVQACPYVCDMVSVRGSLLSWEEMSEIRGLMNRSPNQIALPFSGFRDQTPPSTSASSPAGAERVNLKSFECDGPGPDPRLALLG